MSHLNSLIDYILSINTQIYETFILIIYNIFTTHIFFSTFYLSIFRLTDKKLQIIMVSQSDTIMTFSFFFTFIECLKKYQQYI